MKKIIAISPYTARGKFNLKHERWVYEEWIDEKGCFESNIEFPRFLDFILYNWPINFEIPYFKSRKIAKLIFLGGSTLEVGIFPHSYRYEIIPMVWDCWPKYVSKLESIIKRNNIKTIIFTSSQTAQIFSSMFPKLHVCYLPEGINEKVYNKGKDLKYRGIDLLEFGRSNKIFQKEYTIEKNLNYIYSKNGEWIFPNITDLVYGLSNSKITITLPRCDTHPEQAGNIETLTQRYWECMLSRTILWGRAPKELIELIGYNPVIEMNYLSLSNQLFDIINNIEAYQPLVDKNREMALKFSPWKSRVNQLRVFLNSHDYIV